MNKRPTGCGVKVRLYQNMSNFMINYESVSVRPRFRLNPQPDPSTSFINVCFAAITLTKSCHCVGKVSVTSASLM